MKNENEKITEGHKGNILQNKNREDETSKENLDSEESVNLTKKVGENVAKESPIKTDKDLDKK